MRPLPLPLGEPAAADKPGCLDDLELILLDGQSSGASPRTGQLIELAWCCASAGAESEPALEGGLVRLAPGAGLPRSVTALTGIEERDLAAAPSPLERWRELCAAAARLGAPAPALIHYARFEEPFLRALHDALAPGAAFPLELFCAHAIAQRLLPELPRRGLRALAGYLGAEAPARHRADAHVRATLSIWRALWPRLKALGVRTRADLRGWLASPPPPRRGFRFPLSRVLRLELPEAPGVYHLLGARGELLYVGKAASLRQRVNSHFRGRSGRGERELELLTCTRDLTVTRTGSTLEAALLEADEIRRLAPPYNRALRDDGEVPCFVDRRLRRISESADDQDLGPVLGPRALRPLLLLRALVEGAAPSPEEWRRSLGLDELRRGPGDAAVLAGVRELRARLGLDAGCGPARLLRIGARLWRAQASSGEESPPVLEPPPQPRRWSAARVAEALELALCRGAHLLRRGAFLVELAECSLRWERASGERRVLRVEAGRVSADENGAAPRALPRLLRARSLDASACERLRVLTTELRRLCREGRWLELRRGARRPLDREGLARRLLWF